MYLKLLVTLLLFNITNALAFNSAQFKVTKDNYSRCNGKIVHLSFDDGPNTTTTPKILSTLKKHNIPAKFFVLTHQLEKGDLSKRKKF